MLVSEMGKNYNLFAPVLETLLALILTLPPMDHEQDDKCHGHAWYFTVSRCDISRRISHHTPPKIPLPIITYTQVWNWRGLEGLRPQIWVGRQL